TDAGTVLFEDFRTGAPDGNPENFCIYNGKLYFSAVNSGIGEEPMVTDGTPAGTHALKDLSPGLIGSEPVSNFTVYNNKLYFTAWPGSSGVGLYETDGTEAGTNKVEPAVVTVGNPLY